MLGGLENKLRKGYSLLSVITIASIMSSCYPESSEYVAETSTPTPTYIETIKTQETEEPLVPTETIAPVPTSESKVTLVPTPQPEPVKSTVMESLEKKVNEIRLAREENSGDYEYRINQDLAGKYVVNFLFVGNRRTYGPPDVFKVFSIERTGEIDITSIPRDLYAPELYARINTYVPSPYEDGWQSSRIQPTLIPVVENITGLPIDYYIYLDDDDLIVDMIDVFGEVEVEIKRKCGDYEPGIMLMTGKIANDYFIQRKCDTDFYRMDRQIQVIEAMIKKIKQELQETPVRGLKDVKELYNLIELYQEKGNLVFNTSTPNIEEPLDNIYGLGFSFIVDALHNRVPWPELGDEVNFGTLRLLYSPWPDGHKNRYVPSPLDEVYKGSSKRYILRAHYYYPLRNAVAEILLGE